MLFVFLIEINLALDAVNEDEGIVDSIAKGRGVRKLGRGVVIKMLSEKNGGRKFKIGIGMLIFFLIFGVSVLVCFVERK